MPSEQAPFDAPLSRIAKELKPSGIRRFFDIAAQMQDVVSLGVGEPDFATPWTIRDGAIFSIERGQTTYTSNHGLPELRQAIAQHIERLYGVRYRWEDEILVTVGVSQGLDLAMRAIIDPGDEVLVPEPCYVSYRPCVELAGGVAVAAPTGAENGFLTTPAVLERHRSPATRAILLGYPSNPTGSVMPGEAMRAVVEYAARHELYIISDEIYDRLVYDDVHTCAAAIPGARSRTILLNGFSKTYAMTGWRIGYACAPAAVVAAMVKIHAYTMLCAPIMSQKAAIEALRYGEPVVQEMVEHYNHRRRVTVSRLNRMGLACHMPQGAFYAFPSIASTGLDSETFAERLLMEERVAVVPGTAFGNGGAGHIRCSYATSLPNLDTALDRMARFVSRLSAPATAGSLKSESNPL